ncbi:MAG TPA: class III extradiol ring-cleavage dioxygenase [Polyangiaceae bacterium]|jgi:aromatic ring-opening dioxygenase catalytic subunit (LigB family)
MSTATSTATKMPTLYIPHGAGPCFFMDWTMGPKDTWNKLAGWLRGIDASLPESPRALVVISAHWEAPVPTVLASERPPLLFDYYGFPKHTYELEWAAPGSPELAKRIGSLLSAAKIESQSDSQRGFDHGVFVPLKVAYPDAKIPTVQLSLRADLDPKAHLAIGRALEPLRDEGVLIVGSGMSFHNMGAFRSGGGGPAATAFDGWLSSAVAKDPEARIASLAAWAQAPSARESHPREEHLLPLMVAAGAAGSDAGRAVFRDVAMGVTISAIRFG